MFLSFLRCSSLTAAILCLSVFVGCGAGEKRPKLHPAHGKLLINNKPANGATIVFHRADGGSNDTRGSLSKANVGEDGTFHASTYQEGDGIPVGDYDLAILWFTSLESPSATDKLSGKFADPQKTDLHVTIKEGDNAIDDIVLSKVTLSERRSNKRDGRDGDQLDE